MNSSLPTVSPSAAEGRSSSLPDLAGHELRNALNLMQLAAEVLQRVPELQAHPAARHAVGSLRTALQRQGRTIDAVTELWRADQGGLPLEPRDVDLPALSARVLDDCAEDARARGVSLRSTVVGTPQPLHTDPRRLHQLLEALAKDVVAQAPSGQVVTLSLQADELVLGTEGDDGTVPLPRVTLRLALAQALARALGLRLSFDPLRGHRLALQSLPAGTAASAATAAGRDAAG